MACFMVLWLTEASSAHDTTHNKANFMPCEISCLQSVMSGTGRFMLKASSKFSRTGAVFESYNVNRGVLTCPVGKYSLAS